MITSYVHPCLLSDKSEIPIYSTTGEHLDVICRPLLCDKKNRCVFCNGKKERKRKRLVIKQLINLFGRFHDACVNVALDYRVVVVVASRHTILVLDVLASHFINFELARTIKSSLVCFSSDDLK